MKKLLKKITFLSLSIVLLAVPSLKAVEFDLQVEWGANWGEYDFGSFSRMIPRAIDKEGNTIFYGSVHDARQLFPTATLYGPGDPNGRSFGDLVIQKINHDGTQILWTIIVGGSENEDDFSGGQNVVVGHDNSIYLLGNTYSDDFPLTSDALPSIQSNDRTSFLMKISSNGEFLYSTFFSHSATSSLDRIRAVGIDNNGQVLIGGTLRSPNIIFPMRFVNNRPPVFNSFASNSFFSRFSSDLSEIEMSRYVEGSVITNGDGIDNLGTDNLGNFIVMINAFSSEYLTTPDAISDTLTGSDAYIAKYDPTGINLLYGTYFGGTASVASGPSYDINSSGEICISQIVRNDGDHPLFNAHEDTMGGGLFHGALAKINSQGELVFSTFLSGSEGASLYGCQINEEGHVFVRGVTSSPDFETTPGGIYLSHDGTNDGYLRIYNEIGELGYSTYYGSGFYFFTRLGPNEDLYTTVRAEDNTVVVTPGTIFENAPFPNHVMTKFNVFAGPGEISFEKDQYEAYEADGEVTVLVERRRGHDGPATFDFATEDGSAMVINTDYVGHTGNDLEWGDGEFESIPITIRIPNDSVVEGPKTFKVKLDDIQGAFPGEFLETTVTILDNDFAFEFVDQNPQRIDEDDSEQKVVVEVQAVGSWPDGITVDYTTIQRGTGQFDAIDGEDYTGTSVLQTLTWVQGGPDIQTIEIPIINDHHYERIETFLIELRNPSGEGLIEGENIKEIIINDDDQRILEFFGLAQDVQEGEFEDDIFRFRVMRHGTNQEGSLSFDFEVTSNEATLNSDYRVLTPSPMTWGHRELQDQFIEIEIIDDLEPELDELLNLRFFNVVGGGIVSSRDNVDITILDNEPIEPATVSFDADQYSTWEDRFPGGRVRVLIERSGDTTGTVTVKYRTVDGSASFLDSDYTPIDDEFTWGPTETDPHEFYVEFLEDSKYERIAADGNWEDFFIEIYEVVGGEPGQFDRAEITIIEDDIGVVIRGPQKKFVDEGAPRFQFDVDLVGSFHDVVNQDFFINFQTETNGSTSAIPDEDFESTDEQIRYIPTDRSGSAEVLILNNPGLEPDENFYIDFTSPDGFSIFIQDLSFPRDDPNYWIESNRVEVVIQDTDTEPKVSFQLDVYENSEDDPGQVSAWVERQGALGQPLTIKYRTRDNTALENSDYVPVVDGEYTWEPTDPFPHRILLDFVSDLDYEVSPDGDFEDFFIEIYEVIGAEIGNIHTSRIRILNDDDELAIVEFVDTERTVFENEALTPFDIPIKRSGNLEPIVNVDVIALDPHSLNRSWEREGPSVFEENNEDPNDPMTFRLRADEDLTEVQGETTITFELVSNDPGVEVGTKHQFTLTVKDNEPAVVNPGTIEFGAPTYSMRENEGSMEIALLRKNGTDERVSVRYEAVRDELTREGGATPRTNFEFIWDPGDDSPRYITLEIIDDNDYQGLETVELNLVDITGGATYGPQRTTRLIVNDDEFPSNNPAPPVTPPSPNLPEVPPSTNMFNPTFGQKALLQTYLSGPGNLEITIYDLTGRETIKLVDDFRSAGPHEIPWTGFDGSGEEAEPGVYTAIIDEAGSKRSLQIVLLR